MDDFNTLRDQADAKIRRKAIEQCAGVLLGERGRLQKLQQKVFQGSRDVEIRKLYQMAVKLRKLK